MGLDNMRGSHGRCPPLLVACLLVMCVGLVFNWWSLSSQNFDLIKQLEELSDQLKISFDQQDACLRQKQIFGGRIKSKEEEIAKLNVKFDELLTESVKYKQTVKDREEESKKSRAEIQESADRCNAELESLKKLDITRDGTIETLRLEKEELTSQIQEKNEEIKKLKKAEEKAKALAEESKKGVQKEHPAPAGPVKINSSTGKYQPADLPTLSKESVKLFFPSMTGMVMHPEDDILPHDPPIVKRPEFHVSVTGPTASSPANNISVGGNHEQDKEQDEDANLKDVHDDVPDGPEVAPDSNQPEQRMLQPPEDSGTA